MKSRVDAIRAAYEAERRRPKPPKIVRCWNSIRFRFKMAWMAATRDNRGFLGAVQSFFTSRLYSDMW